MCFPSLSGIAGSNLTGGVDVCLVGVACCQVEVSASGRSLVRRSPTECGVSECDRERLRGGLSPLELTTQEEKNVND